jgi:hypothetical protein
MLNVPVFFPAMSATATAVSGNDWMQLKQVQQEIYVSGVVDLWGDIAAIAKRRDLKDPLSSAAIRITGCMSNKFTYIQIAAIVKKHMDNNPQIWHDSMSSLTGLALFEVCPP